LPLKVLDDLRRWVAAEAADAAALRFRRLFALIWLTHDVCDLLGRGTASQSDPLAPGRPPLLTIMQLGLIAAELGMVLGRPSAPLFSLLAVMLRIFQAAFYPLNDFFYFVVIGLLLLVPGNPHWRRQVLVWQTAWIYLATGLLKLNDQWLSGGHLFVRFGYLWQAAGWPHPPALERCVASLSCTSMLAVGAVLAELALGILLLVGRGRRPAIALAVGVHLFAALALNVWFFGASMVAQVVLLFPGAQRKDHAARAGSAAT
jgi:uncharacterized membrane protein YphA (DoxX/SURF4 family)